MKVLVTGANGFLGNALTKELIVYSIPVKLSAKPPVMLPNVEYANVWDIDRYTDWSKTLLDIDVVIHLAARVHVMNDKISDPLAEFRKVNVEGTLTLATQAAKADVRRFIFISSAKVNGEHSGKDVPFTEVDIPAPQNAYAISKLEAEQGLLKIAEETGMEVVIIRPPLVYGPNVKANFASMLRVVKRGIPLPLGSINNKRSFIYVENLVNFILLCIKHPLAANETFLVSDGHDLSTTELLQKCAFALSVKSRLVPAPQKLLEVIASMLGKRDSVERLCGNLQVDITKARTLLGWTPSISVGEGLRKTAANLSKTGKQ